MLSVSYICKQIVVQEEFSFFSPLSWRDNPLVGLGLHPLSRRLFFLDHTQRHTTVCRTLLDEWSARRRDLNLTTHNTYEYNRQTSMPPVGFEPLISAGKRPQTYALDRAATGTGSFHIHHCENKEALLQQVLQTSTVSFHQCSAPIFGLPNTRGI